MTKKWFSYILFLFPVLIFSQKKDSLQPGTSSSISFTIENKTSETSTFDISIETSNDFITPILKNGQLSILPNNKDIYIVPLKIATETPQGAHKITLKVFNKNTGEETNITNEFIVLGHRKLTLISINSQEFVKAGETIKSTFLLKNHGNISEKIILESKNAIVNGSKDLTLTPGEEKLVTVTKNTNPDLGKNEVENINLSAISKNKLDEIIIAYTSVKVISTKPVEEDIFHRMPVSASLSFVGMQNRGIYKDGFQGEIYGKGSLDEENKNLVEFHAITKNPVEFNSFTQYEEYFFSYKRDKLFVHLGDKNYSSSFLTEYARYGRGAEILVDIQKIRIGGFYNHPRFFRDIKDEFNMYTKYKFTKDSEITFGYLYKIPRIEQTNFTFSNVRLDSNAHLPYIAGKFKINKNIAVSGETSYSKTDKTDGTAFMLQTNAHFKLITGNVMYTRASRDYAGYFNNTNIFNGNIQLKVSNKLNLISMYNQDARNFQRDTLFLAAPYRKYFQYGIQYRYLSNGSIFLYNGFQRYEDRMMTKAFDYKENFFKVSIDQQLGIFQLNFEGQFGKTTNFLSNFSGNSSFYTANIGFEKFKTSFNLYGSYALSSRYQQQNQKQFYYGARVFTRFADKTSLSLFYQNNYIPEDYYTDRNLFELLFHQQVFKNQDFDLSARYNLQRGEMGTKDFIFSLRYTLRMNVPTQKTAEYTTLFGTISNLGVKKVDGVRLLLGNHLSVTDKRGNYIFKNVAPGDYVLEIDRTTTELNDIPDVNLPASLVLDKNENIFNFGLTSAGNIQGNIEYSEHENSVTFAQQRIKKDKKKKENLIIEATNGDQILKKIAVIGQNFDFSYLRPGNWKIKVYRNGLDKRYKIPIDQFNLELKPSESKTITIHVIKQQTEIKYQKESIKVSYNENKK